MINQFKITIFFYHTESLKVAQIIQVRRNNQTNTSTVKQILIRPKTYQKSSSAFNKFCTYRGKKHISATTVACS